MDKKNLPEINDWSGMEKWLVELIQQAKDNARRWFIAWLITLIALIGTNMAWIYVFQSYDYITQNGEGVNNANTGTQGDVNIGTDSQSEEER